MLFRRREVWLPTLSGWLVLLAGLGLALVLMAHAAYGFLAPNEPARGKDGAGARTLVVEGWVDEADLVQALAIYRRGHYERVLTTGGPIDPSIDVDASRSYAIRTATYLRRLGPAGIEVIALPAPESKRDRTYHSATMVRAWALHSGIPLDAIDVFTAGVHARRSRLLYHMALGPDVEVGVYSGAPADYDAEHWWTSSSGTKSTMGETLSLIWTKCCFWPGPAGGE